MLPPIENESVCEGCADVSVTISATRQTLVNARPARVVTMGSANNHYRYSIDNGQRGIGGNRAEDHLCVGLVETPACNLHVAPQFSGMGQRTPHKTLLREPLEHLSNLF